MAWIFLAGSEESPSPWHPGSGLSPTVKVTDMLSQCSSPGWQAGICQQRQSGTTCEACRHVFFRRSISSPGVSRARTSVLRELERAWKASEADLYLNSSASLANADLPSFSWKTFQLSLFGGSTGFCWNSMRWGMMRAGLLFQPQKWEPRTSGSGSGFLPTPTASDYGTGGNGVKKGKQKPVISLGTMARQNLWPTPKARDCRSAGIGGGAAR